MKNEYSEVCAYLESNYEEVDGCDFYRELFPNNEKSGELHTDFSRPNAIFLYKDELDTGRRTLRRRIMLQDTWEEDYRTYVERNPMTLCSGLAYRRRANRLQNAQRMHALIIDLDGVGLYELKTLLFRFEVGPEILRSVPHPTFLVVSGSGLHLYYVFEQPLDLYPNIKVQMKSLKYNLTFRIWDYKYTTWVKEAQYQSINQGFRMVGSVNSKYGTVLRAFRVGGRVTLDYLNSYAIEGNRVDLQRPFKPSKLTREEAREKYPDWYQRVVVEGRRNAKKWDICSKQGFALYEWWLNKVGEIGPGHRYFFLMCLAIYAYKCDVPKAKLRKDMKVAFDELQNVEHVHPDGRPDPMRPEDMQSALEAYDKEYYNFTIRDIERLADVRIERNRRNGRPQLEHLKRARAVQSIDFPNGEWRNKDGRPTAQQRVADWQTEHPDGRKADCIRDTGLSKPTVYRWWRNMKQ